MRRPQPVSRVVPATLAPEEVKTLARALNRTWEVIAGDYLALGGGKPVKRLEVLGATLDYVGAYGRDPLASKLLERPGIYEALRLRIKEVFPFEKYGL